MKTIYSKLVLIALSIFFVGCSDDDTMSNTKVSAVEALYSPKDNVFLNLTAKSSAIFEWQTAKAEDDGVVLYDVVFDVEGGDFSKPLFVSPSDGKGFQPTLTMSFANLNKVAQMAGIQPDTKGKLKWTVWTSKGLNIQKSPVSYTIEVQRPAGFPTPDQLFITGSATEGGENIADALVFKKSGENEFEIYTKLKAGEYKFVTANSGAPESFVVNGTKLSNEGTATHTGDDKVYRIRIDFSNGNVDMVEISKIELWFPPESKALFEYTYAGKGIWTATDKKVVFKQESWGRDERYKFQVTTMNGGTESKEYFGSSTKDNNRPTATTPASFWFLNPIQDNSYDFTYKFAAAVDNATVDGRIDFSGSAAAYTHSFTVK